MKVIRNFMAMMARVIHKPVVKYSLITIIGIVLVGFVGENSLLAHLRNKQYIGKLAEEIDTYNEHYRNDMRQIRALNSNPKAMERIARERYFMKQDDEDIFVLSDDVRMPQQEEATDEAAE